MIFYLCAHPSRVVFIVFLAVLLSACTNNSNAQIPVSEPHFDAGVPGAITDVMVQQVGSQSCTRGLVPVTFGQPFRKGDVPAESTIHAYHNGRPALTQTDIKARNKDGSVRHAIITVQVPCDAVRNTPAQLELGVRPESDRPTGANLTIQDILASHFGASIALNVAGKTWTLDVRQLLQVVEKSNGCAAVTTLCRPWLSGPLVSAWIVGGPFVDGAGDPHPHLAAYFAIRAYGHDHAITRVRVDVIVENNWIFVPKPHNYVYDAKIAVGGKGVYAISDLTHYRQSRWHRAFWWGDQGVLYGALNAGYLQASRAVPNYENVKPTQRFLSQIPQSCAPMRNCGQTSYMATTGAQASIGPLPRWTSVYSTDTDYRAYLWMLANADALGSYSVHYRMKNTGQPVSIEQYPCLTTLRAAEHTHCKATGKKSKIIPHCSGNCKSPLTADEAHHPAPAYVAYLVTGNWYYMTELQFWANWVIVGLNPSYRNYSAGLIKSWQMRGQAWALRTLGDTAYILPDSTTLKQYFNKIVANNIRWFNKKYTNNPEANELGIINNGTANHYNGGTSTSPWQQSFFMWSVGNLADMGFPGATQLRDWLAHFWISLMTSPDFCWPLASSYTLKVRNSQNSAIYQYVGEVYDATFPNLQGVPCDSSVFQTALENKVGSDYAGSGTMVGYPDSPTGFPANFQIGLAAAVDSGLPAAQRAWRIFSGRSPKPNYSNSPQFAIIPRSLKRP